MPATKRKKLSDNPSPLVSVIIPAYKQEKTIVKDINRIHRTMSKTRWDFEIVVVVDGFVDKTYQKAKSVKKKNVSIYGYENNKGKGYAIRYGFARAGGDLIAFIDSGMDINPNGISMVLEHMEWYNADIIVGSKRHPASKINYPLIRKIYSICYYILIRVLFDIKLRDTQSGLKVFKRKVLKKVLPRLVVKEFAIDIEMLVVSKLLGYKKIYEAPIEIKWEKENTNFTAKMIFDRKIQQMIVDTLAVFYRLKILNYYSNSKKRLWKYDKDLEMRVNTGKYKNA
jgi:glycosyltransferase involved in cell wall biosynthesis